MANKQIHELAPAATLTPDDRIVVSTASGNLSRNTTLGALPFKDADGAAVVRPIADKLAEQASVRDFGAVGDGSADDAPAFRAALAARASIFVPPGTYRLAGIVDVLPTRRILGAGRDVTTIVAEGDRAFVFQRNEGAFVVDPGSASDWNRSSIAGLTIRMTRGGIKAFGHEFRATDIGFFGGAATGPADEHGWCLDLVDANECHLSGINAGYGGGTRHRMNANGIRWRAQTAGVNYGDSLVQEVSIKLASADTIGVLLDGHTATGSTNLCNNMVLQRLQVNAPLNGSGLVPLPNTIGVKLWNAARISLIDCNIEVVDVAFEEYSQSGGGAAGACVGNAYLNCAVHNCNTHYRDSNAATPRSVIQRTFLGGDNLGPITTGNAGDASARAQDGDSFLQGAWIAGIDGRPAVQLRARDKDVLLLTGDNKGAGQPLADGHPAQIAPYHGFVFDLRSTESAKLTRPVATGAANPDGVGPALADVRLELGNGEGDVRGELARVQVNDPLHLPGRTTEPKRPIDGLVHHAATAGALPPTGEWYLGPGLYAQVNGGEHPPVAVQRGAVPEKERNADFTVSPADFGKILRVANASDRLVTIPAGLVQPGSGARRFWVIRQGTGRVTFAGTGGLPIRSTGGELSIAEQYQMVEVVLTASEAYLIHILPDALERYERPLHWTGGNFALPASYLGKLVRVSHGDTSAPRYLEIPTGIVPLGMDAVSFWVMKAGPADVEIRVGAGMTLASPSGTPYRITQANKVVEIVVTNSVGRNPALAGKQPDTVYVID
ncbi:MAG: hypothetical protein KDE35_09840 [Geminicoccaceae bacterium]|nr:hypothetical protein [Geminicoccaceae bacterium]